MAYTPAGLDHVNIYVRNAARSHEWYTDVFGFHTQDTIKHPDSDRVRAVFLSCDKGHAHDIALFEVGDEAPGPEKKQVGLNHVAWRMASLDDLKEMYARLKAKGIPLAVGDHTVSIGLYFDDPDGHIAPCSDCPQDLDLGKFAARHLDVDLVHRKIEERGKHRGVAAQSDRASLVISEAKMRRQPAFSDGWLDRAIEELDGYCVRKDHLL